MDRRRNRPVRHLEWRVRLFGAGAVLGVVGIATDTRWLVWVAIAVLAGGFLLRFLPGEGEGEGEEAEESPDAQGPEAGDRPHDMGREAGREEGGFPGSGG